MAFKIRKDCIICKKCEPVCPTNAIFLGEDIFEINPRKCNECRGLFDEPQCVIVCPVNVIFRIKKNDKV
jgi:ferredoxin